MYLIFFSLFEFLVGWTLNFMAYFIFFEHETTHFNRGMQINFVDVPSADVRSEDELSLIVHPHHQTNVNVECICPAYVLGPVIPLRCW